MLRNVGSNWVITVATVCVTFVVTPFLVHTLGESGYGTWLLIASLTGYLNLLALGVPMASVRYIAEHIAARDQRQVNIAIGSCAGLYLMLGAFALACGAALYVFFSSYDIPATLRFDARVAFVIAVVCASSGFIALLPEGVTHAYDEFVPRNIVRLVVLLLRLGLILSLLSLRPSLVILALILLFCQTTDFGLTWLFVRTRYRETRIRLANFDWGMVRRIFSFSLYVLLLYAGTRLSFHTDSIVIGAFMDVGAIPFYAVANSFIIYLIEFIIAIAAVVMPTATRFRTQSRLDDLRRMFFKWSKIALSVTLLVGLYLVVLGPRFIGWWIDPSFEGPSGSVLRALMFSSFVFLPARGVALPVLMGVGKPRQATIAYLVAGCLNLALSIALVGPLGLLGVALGTAIPNVLFALFIMGLACRELATHMSEYMRYTFIRPIVGSLPVLGILAWLHTAFDVRELFGLVAVGLVGVIVFCLVWVGFVYHGDAHVDVHSLLVGVVTKVARWF